MTATTPDANDVLFGKNSPTAKFEEPGVTHSGTVAAPPRAYQEREYDPSNPGGGAPKVFPSGDPIYGLQIDLATDVRDPSIEGDTGVRTLYIEGKRLKDALREAVRRSGATKIEPGAQLTVTFTHREDPSDRRSAKHYKVDYVPAAQAAVGLGQPVTQQAPAVAATAPSVPPQAAPVTPTPAAAPAPAGPQPAQIEALLAAGVDPRTVFAGVELTPEQAARLPQPAQG